MHIPFNIIVDNLIQFETVTFPDYVIAKVIFKCLDICKCTNRLNVDTSLPSVNSNTNQSFKLMEEIIWNYF